VAHARVVSFRTWLLRPALRPVGVPRRECERNLLSLVRVLVPQPLSDVHLRGEDLVIFEMNREYELAECPTHAHEGEDCGVTVLCVSVVQTFDDLVEDFEWEGSQCSHAEGGR